MKINMEIIYKFYKTSNNIPFYEYLIIDPDIKDIKSYIKQNKLISINDNFKKDTYYEISKEEYDLLINSILPLDVIQ